MMKKIFIRLFFVIIIFTIFLIILLKYQTNKLNGDAVSGYHNEGKYYILTYDKEYKEVSRTAWYFNKLIWRMTIIFSLLLGICFIIFMVVYFFPFVIKESKILSKLLTKVTHR